MLDRAALGAHPCYYLTRLAISALQALQLGSLGWEARFGWSSDALDGLHALSWARLRAEGDAFVVLFLIASGVLVLFALVTVLGMTTGIDLCPGEFLDEFFWFWIGDAILFGVLLVPFISFLLDMLSCEGSRVERARGVECWEGVHIFYATMAAAALLTLLLASIVKGGLQNRWAHEARNPERMRSTCNYWDSRYQAVRVSMNICSVFLSRANGAAAAAVMLALALVPLLYFLRHSPHIVLRFNILHVAMHATVAWFSFVTLVAAARDDASDSDVAYAFIPLPLVVAAAALLMYLRARAFPIDPNEAVPLDEKAPGIAASATVGGSGRELSGAFDSDAAAFDWIMQSASLRRDLEAISLRRRASPAAPVPFALELNTARALANAVALNPGLRSLTVSGIALGPQQVDALLVPLRGHPGLQALDLFDAGLAGDSVLRVVDTLLDDASRPPQLRKINVGENNLNAATREALEARVAQQTRVFVAE